MRNGYRQLPRPTSASSNPRHPTARASLLPGAALLVALAACAGGTGTGEPPAVQASAPAAATVAQSPAVVVEANRRADAALDALVQGFWSVDARAFTVTPGGAPAAYWISAEALDAVVDGVERGGQRWTDVARAFVAGQDARGWSRDFFDDQNWMALALVRLADLTGDGALLSRAEALLDDIMATGWDQAAGNVWWDRQHTQKATASNAGPVITAARLFERTGDRRRLDFARSVFARWMADMVDPATGQVADHVDAAGNKVWWRFTYNEGAMIGAAVALHRATGDTAYLDAARRIGRYMQQAETAPTSSGTALTDGTSCGGDCEQFKGIGERFLADLAEADPQGGWATLVETSAAAAWDLARDPATTTFGVDWASRTGPTTLATQSSAAMALHQAARLAARGLQ